MEVGDSFRDWEEVSQVSSNSDPVDSRSFEEIQAHSEGLVRLDHFSLDHGGVVGGYYSKSEEGSGVESDNPSWIDPGTESAHFLRRDSGEFWSESGSDLSEDRKVGGFEGKWEVGIGEAVGIEGKDGKVEAFEAKWEVGIGEAVGVEGRDGKVGGFEAVDLVESLERQVDLERFEGVCRKVDDSVKFWSDSGGDGEDLVEGEGGIVAGEENLAVVAAAGEEAKSGGQSKEVVWWKMPLEMIKYCLFRVSPVWSFSMAAAVLGFVILGRRLYKMKRRTQSLQLNFAVDDKVMSRAARLNEAFSVVRRVPIIRPLLPTTAVNPCPVMTLR